MLSGLFLGLQQRPWSVFTHLHFQHGGRPLWRVHIMVDKMHYLNCSSWLEEMIYNNLWPFITVYNQLPLFFSVTFTVNGRQDENRETQKINEIKKKSKKKHLILMHMKIKYKMVNTEKNNLTQSGNFTFGIHTLEEFIILIYKVHRRILP